MSLIAPYGGFLKNLLVDDPKENLELKNYAARLPALRLSVRALCDLEMLTSGAFSPLDCFMNRADYESVIGEMRLTNGHVFPIPVTLPVNADGGLLENMEIALRDVKNNLLAVMKVEEMYEWNQRIFAAEVLGTTDLRHPLVSESAAWGKFNISGNLKVLELPKYYDFPELRLTPSGVRSRLSSLGNDNVVAFQTRNPLHRAHEEMTKQSIRRTNATLLLHPVVGMTKPGDVDYYSRVRTYKLLVEKYYDKNEVLLALLPLAMRMAGPREALWHALIRRNYGANHLIVGRDHASPGADSNGKPFYDPYAAQELVERFSNEIGVRVVPFQEFVYSPDKEGYLEISQISRGKQFFALSGTEVRENYLNKGRSLPTWFTRPEISAILEETYPPRRRQGFCVWFTGLSGAGKSTTAEILTLLLETFGRRVTLLDGDVVRTNLSEGLGFDKKGRDANVRRIGFVAAEVVKHSGAAVCAAISPYCATRSEVRKMVGETNFIEVFVDTPLDVCEKRDTKGMYAKARRGEIKDFTGIDDVYEKPQAAEIVLQTTEQTPEENARLIINYLLKQGFLTETAATTPLVNKKYV
jgi:sulfate adenylyltransferase